MKARLGPVHLVTAACAVLATLAWAEPAGATFGGRDGAIVYQGRASARGYLFMRTLDSRRGDPVRTAGVPSDPSISPRGRRIAFASGAQIWIVSVDGTGLRQITAGPVAARQPSWSPAGDALAFAGGGIDAQDIYRVSADGNGVQRLTSRHTDEDSPAWSSRDRIAFVQRSSRGDGDILSMRATGHGSSRPVTTGGWDDDEPTWSPDGRALAFTRDRSGIRDVYVKRLGARKPQRLTHLDHSAASPVWSPDGHAIAFVARGASGRRSLFVMRRDGRRLRRVGWSAAGPLSLDWQPRGLDPLIAAAGDIACDPASSFFNLGVGLSGRCAQRLTSDTLLRADLSAVLALGDLQYEEGDLARFMQSFDPAWGRLKPLIRPVVGNHEYRVPDAGGYFDYFNGVDRATGLAGTRGEGYYGFDVGRWHVVVLNSECSEPHGPAAAPSCAAGSPQEIWLRADLAAHRQACTLAAWHHPLVSSGIQPLNAAIAPLWQALADNHVDLALVGHDHGYERFGPIGADGARNRELGVRQFVVGTGGKSLRRASWFAPNSEVRRDKSYGILELRLGASDYSWRFVDAVTGRLRDSGSDNCH
jgi:WD40 repeat protein/calcineurin-like phosphoesterase family protein